MIFLGSTVLTSPISRNFSLDLDKHECVRCSSLRHIGSSSPTSFSKCGTTKTPASSTIYLAGNLSLSRHIHVWIAPYGAQSTKRANPYMRRAWCCTRASGTTASDRRSTPAFAISIQGEGDGAPRSGPNLGGIRPTKSRSRCRCRSLPCSRNHDESRRRSPSVAISTQKYG